MELTLGTPALIFPAISLLMLAYTNRFLSLANLVRKLHCDHKEKPDPLILREIGNLRHRIHLIRGMQTVGVLSMLLSVMSILALFAGFALSAKLLFGLSLTLMMASLALSVWEIQISVHALDMHLHDLEKPEV
jgi:hypothetical protein